LRNEYALTPLRTRGLARVRLHADLVMIARLGQALASAWAVPLAASLPAAANRGPQEYATSMAEATGTIVACGRCGLALHERSDTAAAKCQPCPRCWSMNRTVYGTTPFEAGLSTSAKSLMAFMHRLTGH
jgi:hypothetical protein